MMRKHIPYIAFVSVLVVYMLLTMGYISKEMKQRNCAGYKIDIKNLNGEKFIDNEDIKKMLLAVQGKVQDVNLDEIPTENIELQLKKNPWLLNAECYKTVDNHIKVNVWQRTPVVRYINGSKNFYMDEAGYKMPPSMYNVAYVPVVSGLFPDSVLQKQLLGLVEFIKDDKFLSAQIQQFYINSDREFILIPRAGNQEILFGDAISNDKIEQKFNKLIKLYQEEFAAHGWNRYRSIDLRFDNQVICTKK